LVCGFNLAIKGLNQSVHPEWSTRKAPATISMSGTDLSGGPAMLRPAAVLRCWVNLAIADKYALATDRQTNEQTNRRTSLSRTALACGGSLTRRCAVLITDTICVIPCSFVSAFICWYLCPRHAIVHDRITGWAFVGRLTACRLYAIIKTAALALTNVGF